MLKNSMNLGVAKMVKGMNSVGGYTYQYGVDGRTDLSVSAWNYQAMKAAYASGCDTPGLENALYSSIKCLKSVLYTRNDTSYSGFVYCVQGAEKARGAPKDTMTGAGTLCLQLLGEGGSLEALGGFATIEANMAPGKYWIDYGKEGAGGGLYGWYYQTQAVFQGTGGVGPTWTKWNKQMKRGLISAQQRDGHWEVPPSEAHHGGCENGLNAQLYATTLACLTLEVYYRFLPTFKGTGGLGKENKREPRKLPQEKQAIDDDTGLRII